MAAKAITKSKTKRRSGPRDTLVSAVLRQHFGTVSVTDLRIAERQFPFRVRADLQRALEGVLSKATGVCYFCGVHQPYSHEGVDFAALMVNDRNYPPVVMPPHYDEVDVGEEQPVRCLRVGLWLLRRGGQSY